MLQISSLRRHFIQGSLISYYGVIIVLFTLFIGPLEFFAVLLTDPYPFKVNFYGIFYIPLHTLYIILILCYSLYTLWFIGKIEKRWLVSKRSYNIFIISSIFVLPLCLILFFISLFDIIFTVMAISLAVLVRWKYKSTNIANFHI